MTNATRVLLAALTFATAFPLSAAELNLNTATSADIQAAFKAGLTSEKLTAAYLARIDAYDKKGPVINAVITLNPKALAEAKALDAELKSKGPRSPLHGVPVLLKDNVDTFDLPTTGGSQLLEGSLPPDDAFITKKLRDAGAVILAKVNLSEWAGSGGSASGAPADIVKAGRVPNGFSSAGGQTLNPHALDRGPSGSSGGTGAGIAASFGHMGIGTDTGGSIRGPSSANGIAGLKPTRGLMSRDGVIPLGLSYDTAGPMARSVYDVAAMLGSMTGIDPADSATLASGGHYYSDYTQFLKRGALKGARIGVARDFTTQDPEVERIINESIKTLESLGAIIVDDVRFPETLLKSRQEIYNTIVRAEFKADLTTYLKTTKPGFPKSFDDVVRLSNDPATKYRSAGKAAGLKWSQPDNISFRTDDPIYLTTRDSLLPTVRALFESLFAKHQLDAIIYPTSPRPAQPINPPDPAPPMGNSPTSYANFTGWPDVIVPAGMTKDGLPVTVSFFGRAWTEPALLAYGYDFEQATKARVLPVNTPQLPTDILVY
ncbi:glutamyl-tRNA amidotransferase [Nibricoccus aquaticus]|uniref:Glutamyl-tRNA amidotransferase n=1 Tax=Nibricoccus aquaticus TaxID=2576891 RepID=A0A290QC36_9BACT|nr:amidase family protein [Nibricoccus aquaticus]ATC64760.1 glutamyl-tRNA amidotransferase [Nibricoccus aquaticus]